MRQKTLDMDRRFKEEYPHIYSVFQTAKFHKFHYKELHKLSQELFKCGVMDLTKEQCYEFMKYMHYASMRKK